MKILIIAEAGVNHNGSIELGKQLIDQAANAGADIVKFQSFKAAKLVSSTTQMAEYQKHAVSDKSSQFDMLKELELSEDDHFTLKSHCDAKGIEFLSTAFDEDSLDFLVDKIGIKRIKIPSGEITNSPFIYHAASKKLPIIISTGMAKEEEINLALDFIAFGLCGKMLPNLKNVSGYRLTENGQAVLKQYVTILHCTSDYPTLPEDVHLNTITYLKNLFPLNVGFSDHSQGILAPVGAVGLGVSVIEKHFTLDKNMPGPDHRASLNPEELMEMVKCIRTVSSMLGSMTKVISKSEALTKNVARKFIVASKPISTGEFFTKDNIVCKRSGGYGLEPSSYWELVDRKKASKSYVIDQPIEEVL